MMVGGWRAAAVALAVLGLSGCAALTPPDAASTDADGPPAAFVLEVLAPPQTAALLHRHLDLARFRTLPDLGASELERLVAAAPADARQLLGAQGHFAPAITATVTTDGTPPPRVRIAVDPGPRTTIASVALALEGPDPAALPGLRAALEAGWSLPAGAPFTQAGWDAAKRQALRTLQSRDHPQARVVDSLADIDPTAGAAHLRLRLDTGPAVRLGPLLVTGAQRYPPQQAERLARQAGLRPGSPYDEAALQAAQRALVDSGYYDAAFVRLADAGDPQAHPVVLQVRETRRQRLAVGLGLSADRGPRLSLEHTHHRLPGLDWRAATRLQWERETRSVGTDWTSLLDPEGWRIRAGLQWERLLDGSTSSTTRQVRLAREQPGTALDRALFVQYDHSTEASAARAADRRVSGVSAGFAWTRRAFDDGDDPTRGHGLGVELGAGWTLSPQRRPYARARLRWRGLWPLPEASPRAGRLLLGLEGGAVWAAPDTQVPAGQRFLAGGEGSVRGYAPRSLGVPLPDGSVEAGRLLLLASAEWQRPLSAGGARSPWELVVFADAGAVADRWRRLDPVLGIGAGVRYRSPVGPLRTDLAYGVDDRRWRLHFSVGFVF